MKRSDISEKVESSYIKANTSLVGSIKKLQNAVLELIKEEENSKGFSYVHNQIIDPCINAMKEVAKKHNEFITENKNEDQEDEQIESVKSSKGGDAFKLGADLLKEIKRTSERGTIQKRLINQFPIKEVNAENVMSGGIYRTFDTDRNEIKRETINTVKREDVYKKTSKTGDVSYSNTIESANNYRFFYDNILGSALTTSYQAMLITLFAKLKNIDIINEYPRLLDELKKDGILDIKVNNNIILQPIKNPKGRSPLSIDDSTIAVLTALYEYGGTRDTDNLNTGKKIMDCSQFVEDIFNTGTLTTLQMVNAMKSLNSGNIEQVKSSQFGKILKQADSIMHYDMRNTTAIEREQRLNKLILDLEEGDMVFWNGHVGFISSNQKGEKELLSYTRNRGEDQDATVLTRTFNHFTEYPDYDNPNPKKRMTMQTSNIDGFTKYSQPSFTKLASLKDLYVVKFPKEIKIDDNIPQITHITSQVSYSNHK